MSDIPFSEACERNKAIILSTIKPILESIDSVLEIGSGTAQHAIHFASALPTLSWQTSDQDYYLDGIHAALANAKAKLLSSSGNQSIDNIKLPVELNVCQPQWLEPTRSFDAVYTANTFHIMSQANVEQFFSGLPQVTKHNSYLIVYGPFKYGGEFTSDSNRQFDQSLRARGVGSAIRDFEVINQLADEQGFKLVSDHSMPANNQCLVWQKV